MRALARVLVPILLLARVVHAALAAALVPGTSVQKAARDLRELGFTVLPSRLDPVLVDQCRGECHKRLLSLLAQVSDLGCDSIEQSFSFTECDHRQRLRYDMALPMDGADAAWSQLCAEVLALTAPIIEEAVGDGHTARMVISGVVTSRSGAATQDWHADGGEGLFTVFVPFVDIREYEDGTEFLRGSHVGSPSAVERSCAALDAHPIAASAPAVAAGQPIIFDYRVIHRGLCNPSVACGGRERAIAYIVVSTSGKWDSCNFCRLSVEDALPVHVEHMPFWSDFE